MGKIQRGAIIKSNDNGTLERIDGTGTYIGSATLPSGQVLTKTFRSSSRDEKDVVKRWLKWQGKKDDNEEEATMARTNTTTVEKTPMKTTACPFSGLECAPSCPIFSKAHGLCSITLGSVGLYNISCNLMKLDNSDSIELVAMAVGELASETTPEIEEPRVEAVALTADDGVEEYLARTSFLSFVNLHSKTVYSPYKQFCEEQGYPVDTEARFSEAVENHFDELSSIRKAGGRIFVAV